MSTTPAEIVGTTLTDIRAEAPSVGLAALKGKTPNKALRAAFNELDSIGIQLQKSSMNYRWRALHDVNPKLGHAIEEVLVFGDALFSAWGARQSPEGLKQEYIELKQRFSKIIKETETIATPKEEKKMFSFFGGSSQNDTQKTDLKLANLDTLLEEAHSQSRVLLGKTEKDLIEERAFHKATDWYILALQEATTRLDEVMKDDQVSSELINDLRNNLKVSSGTTSVILSTTDQWLRVKETLHNKSITFLTAHENTFTIIQGHLRSWKDIKNQTEALNALNKAVQMGTSLMSEASSGVEQPMAKWSGDLITPEALQKLSASFGEYDKEVNTLVADLVAPKDQMGPQLSRWDNWDATKRDLLEPILTQPQVAQRTAEKLRPVLKSAQQAEEAALAMPVLEEEVTLPKIELPQVPLKEQKPRLLRENEGATKDQWNRIETKMAQRNINVYRALTGSSFDMDRALVLGWSAQDITSNLLSPIRELGDEVASLPPVIRSEIDYLVQTTQPQLVDWARVASQEVIPFDKDWAQNFRSWMKERDDLDWSYLMQWNDLVYDLLILDQDPAQKQSLFQDDGKAMRQSLTERIEEFLTDPGVPQSLLKTWGFNGLVVRYAMSLDIDADKINKAWKNFNNPIQPIDWDGTPVADWVNKYPNDCQTPSAEQVLKNIDENFTVVSNAFDGAQDYTKMIVQTLSSETLKNSRNGPSKLDSGYKPVPHLKL